MKDPAVLFYISDWLTSTSEMDADCRGWYLNIILHNYDKGDLPDDVEKLAVLAGVKYSEFERFKQVFEQVLKHKFEKCENGRITNIRTNEIIKGREMFKDKRSNAGKLSYFYKFAQKINAKSMTSKFKEFIKKNIDLENLDTKDEQMLKQVFEQLFELYRNGNGNGNKNEIEKWKLDYLVYKKTLTDAFNDIRIDKKYIQELQKIYPKLNIIESILKSIRVYWATEDGWKNKKSKKISTIDWRQTFRKTIELNKVYIEQTQVQIAPAQGYITYDKNGIPIN